MLIQVNGKGFELSPELRNDAEKSMGTALDRFRSRIGRVNMFLEDENGPKNGRDKSLRVIIDIERVPLIVVEAKGDAWHTMLDLTAVRATHTVSRQIDRVRSMSDRMSMAGDTNEFSDPEIDGMEWNLLRQPRERED